MRRWTTMAGLALLPTFLAGCGALGGSTPDSGPAASGSPSAGASWLLISQGNATGSPQPSYPVGTVSPMASGFLPIAMPAPTRPTATTGSGCSVTGFTFSPIAGATVVASATSAVVSWHNPGSANLVQYRVTAISQDLLTGDQRDIGYTVVTPTRPCGPVSATITGLDRRTRYVFSVDAVLKREASQGTRAATVARSSVTSTT